MHSETMVRPATSDLDDRIARVYRYAVRKGSIDAVENVAADLGLEAHEVNEAVNALVESRLLRTEHHGRLLVPVDPEVAAALLVSPMEREIYQRRELIAQIRERTDVFRMDYLRTDRPVAELASVDHVVGSAEVRGYLEVASDTCRDEIMMLQSGRQDVEEFDNFLRMCSRLLARGITVRIVCQHRSRADLTTRMKIKSLTDAGAQVRTVSHTPRAAVVFDRSLAVLLGVADGETTASRVRNDAVVQFLLDMFNHQWDAATPLESFESGYAEVADDLQQTIARLMAKGFTDEVLARKLGMSVRTCRRHIAAMMRDLDAVSRFQAGVQAARRSLVESA
jgi:DNA-binding CsgD family transcriptional regulator